MIQTLRPFTIFLLFALSQHNLRAQTISTLDIVKVNADYEKEAMYFYHENWKPFRVEALRQRVISGYNLLRTATDSSNHFQLILITEYPDSLSFQNKEQHFAPIMKAISPNGPKMLNELKRNDFLEYVSGYDALSLAAPSQAGETADSIKVAVLDVHKKYVAYWLQADRMKLMSLFDEQASIHPNNRLPILGKANIEQFWFPNDGSTTNINDFKTEVISFSMVDGFAVTTHTSYLDWTYEKDATKMGATQKGVNTTLYKKQSDNSWKIFKSMWVDYFKK